MKIFIKQHLGLGDAFAHNGMTRKSSKDYPEAEIFIPAKPHCYDNVSYMYRDNKKINVISLDDKTMNTHLASNKYDKIIYPHFDRGCKFNYNKFVDDAFYMHVGMEPSVRKEYFYVERDNEIEDKIFDEIILSQNIDKYIFLHEKPNQVVIDRKRIKNDLPIIFADPKYLSLHLLKVIERAEEVHVISSSFLSLFVCKKYNPNTFAHMYCGRREYSDWVKNEGIEILI